LTRKGKKVGKGVFNKRQKSVEKKKIKETSMTTPRLKKRGGGGEKKKKRAKWGVL